MSDRRRRPAVVLVAPSDSFVAAPSIEKKRLLRGVTGAYLSDRPTRPGSGEGEIPGAVTHSLSERVEKGGKNMKPTRKVTRRSFMSTVVGGAVAGAAALTIGTEAAIAQRT